MMTLKDFAAQTLTKEWRRRMMHKIAEGKRRAGLLARNLPSGRGD